MAIILLALGVSVATGVFYGAGRLARNTREMTAHSPSPVLIACWAGVSSVIIAVNLYIFLYGVFLFLPFLFLVKGSLDLSPD